LGEPVFSAYSVIFFGAEDSEVSSVESYVAVAVTNISALTLLLGLKVKGIMPSLPSTTTRSPINFLPSSLVPLGLEKNCKAKVPFGVLSSVPLTVVAVEEVPG
jgi:hypothetical protein